MQCWHARRLIQWAALWRGLQFEDVANSGEKTTLWVSCLPGKCGDAPQPPLWTLQAGTRV